MEGASAWAATSSEACRLVRCTTRAPSRARHGQGHVRCSGTRSGSGARRGMGRGTCARPGGEQERPVCAALSEQGRSYKPMVKSSGAQRESEGVVVLAMGVQQNAPGGKGPCFDRAGAKGTGQGMVRTTGPNHPTGITPSDNVRRPEHRLCVAAERQSGHRGHRLFQSHRGDARWESWRIGASPSCMPSAKIIGKPDAGKSHVRFERGSVETDRIAAPRH
jgi:hypothetical protein